MFIVYSAVYLQPSDPIYGLYSEDLETMEESSDSIEIVRLNHSHHLDEGLSLAGIKQSEVFIRIS